MSAYWAGFAAGACVVFALSWILALVVGAAIARANPRPPHPLDSLGD